MAEPALPPPDADVDDARRRTASAEDVLRGLVVALLVAALFGSGSLVGLAERQPFGWQRDVLVGAARSLDRVANAAGLNRPADAAARALGHEQAERDVEALLAQQRAARARAADAAEVAVALRPITAAAPLQLYVGGDSMVRELGNAMHGVVEAHPAESRTDFRVISGLTRPDFFDWPQHLAGVVESERPDAMVLMFGANDFQGIKTDGGDVFDPGSDGWIREYRRRVADVMDLLNQPGATLHWVGLPVMRSDSFTANARVMNRIYAEEAARRPWVNFVSTFEPFADRGGNYAAYLPVGGRDELMRQEDGVHWSSPGATRAATIVFEAVAATWSIPHPR